MSNGSASASASSAATTGVIRIPSYELLSDFLVKGVNDAALAVLESTSVAGDLFNMSRAVLAPIEEVTEDAVILIPLFSVEGEVPMNSDALANGPILYVKLDGLPQPRAVFGTVIAYSESSGPRVLDIGSKIRFPPPPYILVAKPSLLGLVDATLGTAADNPRTSEALPIKRLRTRLPEEVGEPTDGRDDKGMSKYILDLDGVKHSTRNNSDIAQREKDLGFVFRMADQDRHEHIMGTDFTLQVETYKSTVFQQARLRDNKRHISFISCGHLDRVQDLDFIHRSDRLRLLLTGQMMVEGGAATLTLDDFVNGESLSSCSVVCPAQNRPMILVLKNIQTSLQVFLSPLFEGVFDLFIFDLEGSKRPMELVSADFLRYSVEETLRKFCCTVSSERSYVGIPVNDVREPRECASYLTSLFVSLSRDLGDHLTRTTEEEYFRAHLIRESRATAKLSTPRKPLPISSSSSSPTSKKTKHSPSSTNPSGSILEKRELPTKTCAGHLGKQLKAFYADGRPYKCAFGKACKFRHIGRVGKTILELQEIISSLPSTAREDLSAVLKKSA
jgi:hypothetical protein